MLRLEHRGWRRSQAVRIGLVCGTLLSGGLPHFAMAQVAGQAAPPPLTSSIDENGVDVMRGTFVASLPALSIGGDQGLVYQRDTRGVTNVVSTIEQVNGEYVVTLDGRSDNFVPSSGSYVSKTGNGATLTISGGTYTYTSRDGVVATFISNSGYVYPFYEGELARLSTLTYPDGSRKFFAFKISTICGGGYDGNVCNSSLSYVARLMSVKDSNGNQLKLSYAFTESTAKKLSSENYDEWSRVTKVTALNNSVDYCDPTAASCTFSTTWPSLTLGADGSVTDAAGQVTTYGSGITGPGNFHLSLTSANGKVSSVSVNGVTTNYAYSDSGNVRTTISTDALGNKRTYTIDLTNYLLMSVKDASESTTSYEYDSFFRVTKMTYPEGNYVLYSYDGRGNVLETRLVAKAGSGLADIVTTAGFAASCTNAKTCNKPIWTKDPNGNQTDYTYDATHGGLATITRPAAEASADRQTTTNSYSTYQGYYKDSTGAIVASNYPTYKLVSQSTCLTQSACAGSINEQKTAISYGLQSQGIANNLLPVSVSAASGDGSLSATQMMSYDSIGNLLTVDGPLSGAADTVRYRYDALRRIVGVIAADPDGSGPLKSRAERITYNADGQTSLVEQGTVNSQSDGDWASFSPSQQLSSTYDSNTRKTSDRLTDGGATFAVTQYGYDSLGRPDCTTVRMNSATWNALPASACSLQAVGAAGPDRVTRASYDAVGRVTKVTSAYGTLAQSDDVQYGYTSNGQVSYVKDANLNRTTYEYDGFDRLVKTRFPVATKGVDTSSASDFTAFTYGDNVHVTQVRLRDGDSSTIGYVYDNLGRVKSVTPSGESAISYTYDLAGRVLTTQRGTLLLSNTWDALGRLTSEAQPFGSMTYQYNAAGNVTRRTWADGFYVTYDYDNIGQVTAIRENGATSGVGVLATYSYDSLGRRTGVSFGNGTSRSYAFDAAGRLSGLKIDAAGTTNDIVIGAVGGVGTAIGYNPASQITSVARNNDAYAWTGHYNFDRGYTPNGLNQYTASGAVALGYDARGNLTSSGSTTYTYSKLNELTASAGATLYYDGLSRLVEYDAPTSTRFYYSGSQIAAEVANPSGTILRRYVPGPGTDEPVVWYEGSGTTDRRWLHADERGSVIAVTDSAGAAIRLNAYDEYGIPQSTNLGRFQYTGQVWLGEIGLAYYKARMYSPTLGRFMQTDPIGYADGMNWYNYVSGDPINSRDPSGLSDIIVEGIRWPYQFLDENRIKDILDTLFRDGGRNTEGGNPGEILVTAPRPKKNTQKDMPQSGKRSGRKTCDGVPGFAQFETAAQIAISANPVNSYTPAWLRGIFIHSAFSATVRNFSSTSVNVSYKDGGVAGWLDLGSVRPDAVYGDVNSPNFIIELKTGNARLENPQLSNYYNNLPTNTKICEIFENGG
ncbi:RHS repeat domain-containing protein [Sphingomonas sp. IC081]|uniref:RHS repeat domain-containing protein n=1 Tax=Sphingomonas sp. IC081 TaxID=304378 RepID=UPI00115AEBEE|nr:RHS repeat-associated core domain-containing protein [Sphingomonas sp. IC081]QDK35986.1 hypothetical protein DM450_25050 [Sphingomonas sp. IC081]